MRIYQLTTFNESGPYPLSLHMTEDGALNELKRILKADKGELIPLESTEGKLFSVSNEYDTKYFIGPVEVEE